MKKQIFLLIVSICMFLQVFPVRRNEKTKKRNRSRSAGRSLVGLQSKEPMSKSLYKKIKEKITSKKEHTDPALSTQPRKVATIKLTKKEYLFSLNPEIRRTEKEIALTEYKKEILEKFEKQNIENKDWQDFLTNIKKDVGAKIKMAKKAGSAQSTTNIKELIEEQKKIGNLIKNQQILPIEIELKSDLKDLNAQLGYLKEKEKTGKFGKPGVFVSTHKKILGSTTGLAMGGVGVVGSFASMATAPGGAAVLGAVGIGGAVSAPAEPGTIPSGLTADTKMLSEEQFVGDEVFSSGLEGEKKEGDFAGLQNLPMNEGSLPRASRDFFSQEEEDLVNSQDYYFFG